MIKKNIFKQFMKYDSGIFNCFPQYQKFQSIKRCERNTNNE